jgi:hypothetical protein
VWSWNLVELGDGVTIMVEDVGKWAIEGVDTGCCPGTCTVAIIQAKGGEKVAADIGILSSSSPPYEADSVRERGCCVADEKLRSSKHFNIEYRTLQQHMVLSFRETFVGEGLLIDCTIYRLYY